jgi:RNA polymerase sigma factor (sigma-70 family)
MDADTGATPGDRFPATEVSVLRRIRDGSLREKEDAYNTLIAAYWRPVYTYLRLRWREEPADAEDSTQEFLAAAWTKGFFDRYEPGRARFRTFLRVCLDRHVQNQRKAARALKRGGGARLLSLDFTSAEGELRQREPADPANAEHLFQQEFVRSLFADALGRLRAELEGRGRGVVYEVFDRYELGPAEGVSYATVAEELGVSVTQVTNHLHVARSRFRELVVERLRELSGSEEEFREEAREILGLDLS